MSQKILSFLSLICCIIMPKNAFANGIPERWQIGLQEPATPVAEMVNSFHNDLLLVTAFIVLFVVVLMFVTLFKFNNKKNKTPSKTSHHPTLEVIWTIIPAITLVVLGFPSLRLIQYMDKVENPELTLKVVGSQWYWNYEMPELNIAFESRMIPEEEMTKPNQLRLLEVDEPVFLPVNTNIRVLITSSDVLHAWAVPAFCFKKDATPGRISEAWINIQKKGIYYGQCSEICGIDHGFMPIKIHAVSKEKFLKWAENSRKRFM
jgi:cytochrome c oxidase subunit 2